MEMEILKVSSKTEVGKLAGAVTSILRSDGKVEIQVIGAGALNQAIKGLATSRGFLAPLGQDLICIPSFVDLEMNGEERTALKLLVELR